jgi:hypothetical protein
MLARYLADNWHKERLDRQGAIRAQVILVGVKRSSGIERKDGH